MTNDFNSNEVSGQGPVAPIQTTEVKQEEVIIQKEQASTSPAVESGGLPRLRAEEVDEFQSRWNSIQAKFVDEPHASVEQADALVAEALERIVQAFSNKRTMLNGQWINHEGISTEDLRVALQGYRSFFKGLLAL
jgi:hypothetical protein